MPDADEGGKQHDGDDRRAEAKGVHLLLPACGEKVGMSGTLSGTAAKRESCPPSPGLHLAMRHSRSSASAFLGMAAKGGLCFSPQAGRGKKENVHSLTT